MLAGSLENVVLAQSRTLLYAQSLRAPFPSHPAQLGEILEEY
jgi:hypothetical protein